MIKSIIRFFTTKVNLGRNKNIYSFGDSSTPTSRPMSSLMFETRPRFEVDHYLEEDEWHVIFNDYRDLSNGVITKMPFQGGSNMTSTFIVKRVRDDLKRYRK